MAETAVSANRLELLQIADAVAREKVIDKQIVLDAMADAIAKAVRESPLLAQYGTAVNPASATESIEAAETAATKAAQDAAADLGPRDGGGHHPLGR